MKKKIIAITITLLVATAGALTLVQCDHSNMARVTIHIQNDLYAQKSESFIDKILALISTNVYASFYNLNKELLYIDITAPDMQPISYQTTYTSDTLTVELPAGTSRSFKIRNFESDKNIFNWGGVKTINIEPGEQSISIQMRPMTDITFLNESTGIVNISWEGDFNTLINNFTQYNIYRSSSPNGEYQLVATETVQGNSSTSDNPPNPNTRYYYKISISTSNGEGLLSDYSYIDYNG